MKRIVMACLLIATALTLWGYHNATASPLLRRLHYHSGRWPAGTPPIRLVLISDLHMEAFDMPPPRIAALVRRVNALAPDCVLIAGDLTSDKWANVGPGAIYAAVVPLAALRPRIASYAVMGNHDYLAGASMVRRALGSAGIILLSNAAGRCGPIVIGGIDDSVTHHGNLSEAKAAMTRSGGIPLFLSHTPDIFYISPKPGNHADAMLRADVGLNLAGHTHCGQVIMPVVGPLGTGSAFGRRFLCGVISDHHRTILVTAGIGTSHVPIRFNAPPDFWLITIS